MQVPRKVRIFFTNLLQLPKLETYTSISTFYFSEDGCYAPSTSTMAITRG